VLVGELTGKHDLENAHSRSDRATQQAAPAPAG
jgi:hypothetical protein